jgi:hypothetical protein
MQLEYLNAAAVMLWGGRLLEPAGEEDPQPAASSETLPIAIASAMPRRGCRRRRVRVWRLVGLHRDGLLGFDGGGSAIVLAGGW